MKPVEPPEWMGTSRMVWQGPTPDVADLVVRIDPEVGMSTSVWDLTFNERAAILDGARVILNVYGRHPIVALSIEGVEE